MMDVGAEGASTGHTADTGLPIQSVGIIGLGLIGGSIAHDLAAAGVRVLAHDRDPATVERAIETGVVRAPLGDALEQLDAVVIAVPVDAALDVLAAVAGQPSTSLVMDVGGTKRSIVQAARATPLRERFVGAHPLAGDHRSGFIAARAGLFRGATVYLCPTDETAPAIRERAWRFWEMLGAQPQLIAADAHDELLAWTSHLPQAVASSLARALVGAGISSAQLGPGGLDTTRLAASDVSLWSAVLLDNAQDVADALDSFAREIEILRRLVDARDRAGLRGFLEGGRAFRVPDGAKPANAPPTDTPTSARQVHMRITSEAFEEGAEIPTRFTCDGDDVSPPLTIEDVPENARTLALIMDDPDAPMGTFVHWLLWNLPPNVREIPENVPADSTVDALGGARHGITDFRRVGYGGPCPPDRRHTYRFMLYALDTELDLEPGANRKQLDDAMKGHIIAEAMLRATYDRPNR